jgi:hypothetical protein
MARLARLVQDDAPCCASRRSQDWSAVMITGLVASTLFGCAPPTAPHLGTMTTGLRDWLAEQCKPEEVVESRSFAHILLIVDMDDAIFRRYHDRPLVSIGCADGEMEHVV